jgi:phosphatidylglycerophosphate synthase
VSEPIRDAIVHATAEDGARRVAGVPLLLRTLLVLQKAGVERVVLEGPVAAPVDPRLRLAVARGETPPSVPHLAVGGGVVFDAAFASRAVAECASARFEVSGAVVEVVRGEPARTPAPPPAGVLLAASASDAAIERALLRGLENPRDGYLDRILYRHLSRPTTRLLLPTRLTPNQVTVVGVLVGIAGGWLLGAGATIGVLAGVAALLASSVLDCVDGEIARIKLTESRIGHVLDVTGDTLVHVALLAGIAMHLARTGAWPGTGPLALLAAGVVGSFAAITWSEQSEARRHRVPDAWENRILEGVLSPLTTRDWYVFPVAFALAGRLDALVPAAAVGAQVFWVSVLVLVARVLRRT